MLKILKLFTATVFLIVFLVLNSTNTLAVDNLTLKKEIKKEGLTVRHYSFKPDFGNVKNKFLKFVEIRNGITYYTDDGCKTWHRRVGELPLKVFIEYRADGSVMKTTDGGRTWQKIEVTKKLTEESAINLTLNDYSLVISFNNMPDAFYELEFFDLQGNEILRHTYKGSNTCNIDIESLKPGIYFIRVKSGDSFVCLRKFIKF
jgi:hypothetical protein